MMQAAGIAAARDQLSRMAEPWDRFCTLSHMLLADLASSDDAAVARRLREIVDDGFWQELLDAVRVALAEWRARTSETDSQDSPAQAFAGELWQVLRGEGRFEEARNAATATTYIWSRLYALREIATAAARAGDGLAAPIFEQISNEVRAGNDEEDLPAIQCAVAIALAHASHPAASAVFRIVSDTADHMPEPREQEKGRMNLARALAEAGWCDEARKVADAIPVASSRDYALRAIATALRRAGQPERARELVRAMRVAAGEDGARRSIVNALVEAGFVDEARELAHAARKIPGRDLVGNELPALLAEQGLFAEAWEELKWFRKTSGIVQVLCPFAVALAKAGNDRAREAFDDAEHIARFVVRSRDEDDRLALVATSLGEAGWFDRASEVAALIGDPERGEAIARIAELQAARLASAGRFGDALLTLGDSSPNALVRTIAGWAPAFEAVRPGLSVAALSAVTGVAGWNQTHWKPIHDLLAAAP